MTAEKPLIIIPAAGFGTRVGSPNSKELLPHPVTGKPLIEASLNLANERQWPVLVITREEKTELIAYLKNFEFVQIMTIKPSKEWPDSLLASQPKWHLKNILLLPDTEWEKTKVLDLIDDELTYHQVALGVFTTDDYTPWGVVNTQSDFYHFCEKPQDAHQFAHLKAWGLIGFQKNIGEKLFEKLLTSTLNHQWQQLELKPSFIELDYFKDLTR